VMAMFVVKLLLFFHPFDVSCDIFAL